MYALRVSKATQHRPGKRPDQRPGDTVEKRKARNQTADMNFINLAMKCLNAGVTKPYYTGTQAYLFRSNTKVI